MECKFNELFAEEKQMWNNFENRPKTASDMIKRLLILMIFTNGFCEGFAQKITGQWKGIFIDKSTSSMHWGGDRCEYTLELEMNGTAVSGYSYTYFTENGKRYYTICKLNGFYDAHTKYVEVKEIQRTKTNVPVNVHNCFQIHKLKYTKQGNDELLEGTWVPAEGQDWDCGKGITSLRRRVLNDIIPGYTKPVIKNNVATKYSTKPLTKNHLVKNKAPQKNIVNPVKKATVIAKDNTAKTKSTAPVIAREKSLIRKIDPVVSAIEEPVVVPLPAISLPKTYEKRISSIVKTIPVKNKQLKICLYDNGEIDGDSVSLIFNGKLLLSHKRLTAVALNITVDLDNEDNAVNELAMYAENLGSIPPNTALMVITDGTQKYELRISSDMKKSGAVRFLYVPDKKEP